MFGHPQGRDTFSDHDGTLTGTRKPLRPREREQGHGEDGRVYWVGEGRRGGDVPEGAGD